MEHILIGVIVIITIASAFILCGLYGENSKLRLKLKTKMDENYRLDRENQLMKRQIDMFQMPPGPQKTRMRIINHIKGLSPNIIHVQLTEEGSMPPTVVAEIHSTEDLSNIYVDIARIMRDELPLTVDFKIEIKALPTISDLNIKIEERSEEA